MGDIVEASVTWCDTDHMKLVPLFGGEGIAFLG